MKIAVITEIISTHSGSRAPIELAKQLSLNNEITLLAYDFKTEKEAKTNLEEKGIKVVLVKPPAFPFGKYLAALKFLPHLKESEIISFHGTLPAFLVAKLARRPLIKTYYGTQLNAYYERLLPTQKPILKDKLFNWLGNRLTLFVGKIYFYLSDQTVGISHYTSVEAERLYRKYIPFIYLGSNLIPPKSNRIKPIHSKTINLLSVSRLTPYKGFHCLLKVFKELNMEIPQIKLTITGSVSKKNYLVYLKTVANKNVEILTDISDQKLTELYQKCDVYATCDRYLFFGLPLVEAAYFGKPSVALDFAAAAEVIRNGQTGYVAKKLVDFKRCIKKLVLNEKLRDNLGGQAQKQAQLLFAWPKVAKEYEKLFSTILSRK